MSNRLKLTLIVLSILIGIGSAYVLVASRRHTQRQTAAMTLIRDMDSIDQQISQASREFGLALSHFMESPEEADPGALQHTHRTLIESVNQSIAVVSHLQAPESDHGAAFISAQRRFLLVQRRIIREDFGKLLGLLAETSTPLPQQESSIQGIINAAFTETEKEFASVHAIREKFASEFAIHLTTQ
ncbi:MAG: hypothetical protein QGF59_29915 [Pirellulaceae bacterium]|jgi:hypothetical protein|nr:hypothetical protein [Pirellulaceae bacterium]MDP6722918.1 hypothetical protein [Pirellulaceae bacterium]